jgi:predicted PurR-regulated permease PerM
MTFDPAPPNTARVPYERTSFVLAALALLAVLLLHLVPMLLAGFLAWALLRSTARRLRERKVSHARARALAGAILGTLAAVVATASIYLLWGFLKGRIGDLPAVLEKMGEALTSIREKAAASGLSIPLPAEGDSTEAVGGWLRGHGAGLRHAGSVGARGLAHALIGSVIGVLVFFHRGEGEPGPLATALVARARRFGDAFRSVAKAQIEISAVNTVLTALFLFAGLPLGGVHVPLRGTLVAVTFVCGLIPVAGNLVSNTIIVVVALGVSPLAAAAAVVFLLVIHKLEYLLNAKIVGARIGARAWETLLAIVVMEAAFGIPGLIVAPVVYAWVKGELVERGLV